MPGFYVVKDEWHSESCACELQIDWNIPQIAQKENASGFIVQVYTRKLYLQGRLNTEEYADVEYAEAWCVKNGKIIEEDKGKLCDDMFSIGNSVTEFSEFKRSLNTTGRFEFYGSVFWVPEDSGLYETVFHWSRESVKQAAGLKASYEFDAFKDLNGFERDVFIHTWDLTDENIIYSVAKKKLFRYCPQNTKRDEELLIAAAHNMLGEKYRHFADAIIAEWKNQWVENNPR